MTPRDMEIHRALISAWIAVAVAACADDFDGEAPPQLDDEDTFTPEDEDNDDGDAATSGDAESAASTDDGNASNDDAPPSDDSSSSDAGESETGIDTSDAETCDDHAFNVASTGWVSASSVFDPWLGSPYDAELSIDDDAGTSWFSAGPEPDGTPTVFEWYVQQDHCLDTIAIVGNGDHADSEYRQGYGYENMLVEVFDTSGTPVYTENFNLAGTPDPTIEIDLAGTLAHRVVLSLTGHEAPDCGGFSELVITGRAPL